MRSSKLIHYPTAVWSLLKDYGLIPFWQSRDWLLDFSVPSYCAVTLCNWTKLEHAHLFPLAGMLKEYITPVLMGRAYLCTLRTGTKIMSTNLTCVLGLQKQVKVEA